MAKNFYVTVCGTGKLRDSLLSFRYIFVLGLLVLALPVSWLFWRTSELPVQLKSFNRNRVIRPIPPAPANENMRVSQLHFTDRDGLKGIVVSSVQEARNSTPENDYVKQKNEIKGNYAVESSVSREHERGFVIQVGAFRGLARAQNLRKALQDKGLSNNHPDLRFLQDMDTTNQEHLDKFSKLMKKYGKEYEATVSRDVSYDDIAKSNKAMVMLHEGGFAYYKKNMMLSDNDRVLGGEVALRDEKGQLRKFIPEDVAINFGGRDDLAREYARVGHSKNKQWDRIIEKMVYI